MWSIARAKKILLGFVIVSELFYCASGVCQTTNILILDSEEISRFRSVVSTSYEAQRRADSLQILGYDASKLTPRPLEVVHYEGLLENNPDRIDTRKSFHDIDAVVNLIYFSYLRDSDEAAGKAVEIALAWAGTYQPTGNPINENKFVALFWTYHLFNDAFDESEKVLMEEWMRKIASLQMARERTPNNNWQAKRMKIIGIIGCILDDDSLQQFAIEGFKEFIGTAYYADGTSRDLKQRDALHYHVSGLKPCLSAFINLSKFNADFDLYEYSGESGGSIGKSIEYTVPYARGEKQHAEWVNTTVKLDKERAAAGLAEYQPGMFFDPRKARSAFEWAVYYDADWYDILGDSDDYASTWIGLLNSPLVRMK